MNVAVATERQAQVEAELAAYYPRLHALLGKQLRERAGQPDGLVNRLVFSLCGGNAVAGRWESALAGWSEDTIRRHFPARLPRELSHPYEFDAGLDSMLAELEAAETFRLCDLVQEVDLLPEGKRPGPDFLARWPNATALVEVKRADGLASELWLAYAVVDAWRLLFPELSAAGIALWASESYHMDRLGRGVKDEVRAALRARLLSLVHDERGRDLAGKLQAGELIALVDGELYAQRNTYQAGIYVSPFWYRAEADDGAPGTLPQGNLDIAISMASLRGLADVVFRIRSALPQLFEGSLGQEDGAVLVAFIEYAGGELTGDDVNLWAGALSDVLRWNQRVHVIVRTPTHREPWCFTRDHTGALVACESFRDWVSRTPGQHRGVSS
jgi:hypothetical protein